MNEINGQRYTDLGYTHKELEDLLSKIDKGRVLAPAQYDTLVTKIGIDNISTFSGDYNDLSNTPDIPMIVNNVLKGLNLATHVTVGEALEALKNEIDNNIKILNSQKADIKHTHSMGEVIGIEEIIEGKADLDHYHEMQNIMGLDDLMNDKADVNHNHDNVYTKTEIDEIINDVITGGEIDLSGYVTEEQLQDYATKESVKDFITLKDLADKLVVYVTIEELAAQIEQLPMKDHTHKVADIEDIQVELDKKVNVDTVYNKDEINDLLENVTTGDHTHDNYMTKEEADNTYAKLGDSDAIVELIDSVENSLEQHKTDSNNALTAVQNNLETKINMNQEDIENQVSNLSVEVDSKLANKADKFHTHDTYYSKSEIDNKLAQLSGGGSIDLEGYLKQEDILPIQEEVDKLQQDIERKTDDDHTHNYSVADIEGLQEALDQKANSNDAVEIPDNIMSIINNKADKSHEHDYAPLDHEHDEYADVNHTHEFIENNIADLQSELNNKANKEDILSEEDVVNLIKDNVGEVGPSIDPEHNHDDRYALLEHGHDEYALQEHEHEQYALEDHGHNDLAQKEHSHEEYSLNNHSHTEYAKAKHYHDDDYAAKEHIHDYAAKTHTHNEYAEYDHDHKISDITNLQAALDKKLETGVVYTKEEIDKKLVDISSGGTIDLEGFIKQSDLAEALATKAELVHEHNIDEIENLQRILGQKANVEDTATKEELNQVTVTKADRTHGHNVDEIDSLGETLTDLQTQINNKSDKATSATKQELSEGLAEKSDINHEHDEKYAPREHEHENYYTKAETEEVVGNVFESKITEAEVSIKAYTDYAISALTKDAPEDMNTFAGVADKMTEQNTALNTVKNDVNTALANMSPLDHTHDDRYATVEGENEREIFTTTELTVSALGGISAGADLNGLTVKEILSKLLYPYLSPTISITGTPNGGIFEKGNNQTITSVKVVVTKKSEKITKLEVLQGSTSLVKVEDDSIANGGTFTYNVNIPVNSTNVQLTGKVTDATGTIKQATTATFNFVYPYYVGVCGENDSITETLIKGLEKRVEAKGSKTITYTTQQQKMIIAYPKSYGVIRKVLDANSFDVTDTFTRTEIKIKGLDGTSQSYYVYVNNASTVSGFTMTFSY